ncbi:glutaminyl-peptide cyclotransferase [Rhodococcoides corynebacterioides]|uniref:glutaminyl-peptide cyclotransferase n=1 Tax=Rhodococcoides corynebacterioides TaxID=53972 RepID=UPI001C9A7931|nr:glutaminyl-peptide cyclotransferase [Rhodococcus corynebacterioides]MBY6361800.1 glutaminyl-peptide cyclotransferase [Rhodococcus corynebacterioides]
MRSDNDAHPARVRLLARAVAVVLVSSFGVTACAPAGTPATTVGQAERLGVRVLATEPHDPTAFTQGLELDGDRLLEGTGRSGQSRITATDRATGAVLARDDLPAPLFGEGITRSGDVIWQLTWRDGIAVVRDADSLAELRRVPYDGEGWGICATDDALITSDGSDTLTVRDPLTFDVRSTRSVTSGGQPVTALNELECTPGGVWANRWRTDEIVRIDPDSGEVTAVVDAAPLRASLDPGAEVDVLNGIAAVDGTDRFLVTGKLWPTLFEVQFVPADG